MSETLALGVLLALLFFEATGLSPGGIIVPAYFALFLNDPPRVFSTLLAAILVWGIVTLLSHYIILYGQRRFAMFLVSGLIVKMLLSLFYTGSVDAILSLSLSIGYLVPGILARDFERQGFWKTLMGLTIVTGLIWMIRTFFVGVGL